MNNTLLLKGMLGISALLLFGFALLIGLVIQVAGASAAGATTGCSAAPVTGTSTATGSAASSTGAGNGAISNAVSFGTIAAAVLSVLASLS